jgi:hypothetical protein
MKGLIASLPVRLKPAPEAKNPGAARPRGKRQLARRPRLEALEGRLLLSTTTYEGTIAGQVDRYPIAVTAGDVIELNVRGTNPGAPSSGQFDPMVALFDPSGNLVASDDDHGSGSVWAAGLSSQATTTGTWTVAVTAYPDFEFDGVGSGNGPGLESGAYVLTVTLPGQRPIAQANGSYTVVEGGSVLLSSSGSSDLDGSIVTYEWDFDYAGTFTVDANGPSPTFSAGDLDGPSTLTVALRVTDNEGLTSIATATVVITNANPTATFSYSDAVVRSVSFSNPNDPSAADRAAGFKYSYDFNNDGVFEVVDSPTSSETVPAEFFDKVTQNLTVIGRISDKDGGFTEYRVSIINPNYEPTSPTVAAAVEHMENVLEHNDKIRNKTSIDVLKTVGETVTNSLDKGAFSPTFVFKHEF